MPWTHKSKTSNSPYQSPRSLFTLFTPPALRQSFHCRLGRWYYAHPIERFVLIFDFSRAAWRDSQSSPPWSSAPSAVALLLPVKPAASILPLSVRPLVLRASYSKICADIRLLPSRLEGFTKLPPPRRRCSSKSTKPSHSPPNCYSECILLKIWTIQITINVPIVRRK